MFGSQVPLSNQIDGVAQLAAVVTAQVPSMLQQEPFTGGGGAQLFGVQLANIVQMPVQGSAGMTAQVPSV